MPGYPFLAALVVAATIAAPRTAAAAPETIAPFGEKLFCMKSPTECAATPATGDVRVTGGKVVLDAARLRELDNVNRAVNVAISPKAEAAGADKWQLDPAVGDCEDYALSKRHRLIAMGWPSSATLLARVRTPHGALHIVLVAATDRGNYVLDNLSPTVRLADDTPYRWESIQSATDPLKWRSASGTV